MPGWKKKVIGFLFALIVLTGIWSTGVFREAFAGPKIPLMREAAGFSLGMTRDEVRQKIPALKKKLRGFNSDPEFKIATLGKESGLKDASSVDLLFFQGKLYFISAMWEREQAQLVPVADWAKQFRRWTRAKSGKPEPLAGDVLLKEWHFNDGTTEMTLRDLNYSEHQQRWQDLRDASNGEAQAAFSKYRLDGGI
jgi:hypothetical protein